MRHVLIVEDDPAMGRLLRALVEGMRHRPVLADDLPGARAAMAQEPPDLVLLDRRLKPVSDGIDFCLELKRDPRFRLIPVIVLSVLEGMGEETKSYRYGADLCLTKSPETLRKLEEYIAAFLARLPYEAERAGEFACAGLVIDRRRREIRFHGAPLRALPPKLFALLDLIASARGGLVARETVIKRLWKVPVRDRQVDVTVSRLKTLLGPEAGKVIETVRGGGYRLRMAA